jgi:CRISPR system Cascade subunit CasA
MHSFDLTTEGWIPCSVDGGTQELGLRDVFRRATEIEDIVGSAPPVTMALYRLVIAVAHAIFRPLDEKRWVELWQGKQWPMDTVDEYLDRSRSRFDLFDGQRPFLQVPKSGFTPYLESYEKSIAELTLHLGSSNAEMFSHAPEEMTVSFAEAARALVTRQLYAAGGLHAHEQNRQADKFAADGPVARAALSLNQGRNAFETVMLNMVDYLPSAREDQPFKSDVDDLPAWEQDQHASVCTRSPHGYLDWLTWQSRRVLLLPLHDGEPGVARCVLMTGARLPVGVFAHEFEQMAAIRLNAKAKDGQDPLPLLTYRADRAIWRDAMTLLTRASKQADESGAPKTLRTLNSRRRLVRDLPGLPLRTFGVLFKVGQMMVILWRAERLPAPLEYIADEDLQSRLQQAIRYVEGVSLALNRATREYAQRVLAPGSDSGGRSGDKAAITNLSNSIGASYDYWADLEPAFQIFLRDQAAEGPSDPHSEGPGAESLHSWMDAVARSARTAYTAATTTGGSARSLRAAVSGRQWLETGIARARKESGVETGEEEAA